MVVGKYWWEKLDLSATTLNMRFLPCESYVIVSYTLAADVSVVVSNDGMRFPVPSWGFLACTP